MIATARAIHTLLLGSTSSRIRLLVSVMQQARVQGYPRFARLCARRLERYGNYISSQAEIGVALKLPHPTSIVIGAGVVIGSNVRIYQNVTLGGRLVGDWRSGNYPVISDNTVIFAGAVIVGKVKIGRNCIIGANSVVTTDIPDNATAVGAPARVVAARRDETEESLERG